MIVKKNGKVQFSIRFVYASNAIDYTSRCKSISKWFFQCLKTLENILTSTFEDERYRKSIIYTAKKYANRKSSNNFRGHHIDSEDDNGSNNNGNTRKKIEKEIEHQIFGSSKLAYSDIKEEKTALYFNTGLWDWRTGLLPKEYYNNLKKALMNTKNSFKLYDTVIWRTTSAAWPSKFMKESECKSKGKSDKRPCSVHTGEIYKMNELATPLIQKHGFKTLPSWEVTSTRPDLSYDGLHFRNKRCKNVNTNNNNIKKRDSNEKNNNNYKKDKKENRLVSCHDKLNIINHVLNNFFFNELCT